MDAITCVTAGVYKRALTRGRRYTPLAYDAGRQVKVRGDNGRTRWYPLYCFDPTGGDVASIVEVIIPDYEVWAAEGEVDAEILLSTGERRWCWFLTPTARSNWCEEPLGAARLLIVGAPHQVFVDSLSEASIAGALRYLESQNELAALRCSVCPAHRFGEHTWYRPAHNDLAGTRTGANRRRRRRGLTGAVDTCASLRAAAGSRSRRVDRARG